MLRKGKAFLASTPTAAGS
uniref:Uncharacterized protein n=1 Tax=Arundo donax TaxID=35708 RepID=A0A0A9GUW7_ARUDO